MCTLNAKLNEHRPKTKLVDVEKAYLSNRMQAQVYEGPDQKTDQTPVYLTVLGRY